MPKACVRTVEEEEEEEEDSAVYFLKIESK